MAAVCHGLPDGRNSRGHELDCSINARLYHSLARSKGRLSKERAEDAVMVSSITSTNFAVVLHEPCHDPVVHADDLQIDNERDYRVGVVAEKVCGLVQLPMFQ